MWTPPPGENSGGGFGFAKEANFIQHFKKAFAMTPGAYRNEMKE